MSMKKIILGLIIFLSLQSCKEIIATDITETLPSLILPQVSDTVQNNPVQFKWNEVTGATDYHLQIVSPSFANIESYAIDSMVNLTTIFISLDSNEYEMKLTALNEGYTSHTLGPIKFWVGVQPSSSSEFVTLTSPTDASYFNESFTGLFKWSSLDEISSYEFSLRKGSSYQSPNIIETSSGISASQYTINETLDEGEYHWGVKAYFNSGTETPVATRHFYIDTINPVVPILVSPTGSVTPGVVTFSWTNSADPGTEHSPITSVLEVASDVNFTLDFETSTVSTLTEDITLSGTGIRYWRVKNIDGAGNVSSFSAIGEFTLF